MPTEYIRSTSYVGRRKTDPFRPHTLHFLTPRLVPRRSTLPGAYCFLPIFLHASLLQVGDEEEDFDWAFPPEATDEPAIAEDETEGTYRPAYVYSYEQESYEFSYSFELEDLESYSFEFIDSTSKELSYSHSYSYSYQVGEEAGSEPPPPGAVQSVTSMDVSVYTHDSVFCVRKTRGGRNASRP